MKNKDEILEALEKSYEKGFDCMSMKNSNKETADTLNHKIEKSERIHFMVGIMIGFVLAIIMYSIKRWIKRVILKD